METRTRRARHLTAALGAVVLVLTGAMAPAPAAPAGKLSRWTTPVNLSANGGSSPDMVVSGDGSTAVAVWRRKKDGYRIIQARTGRIVDGVVKWSAKQDLSPEGTPTGSPEVAISGDGGTAIVVWASGSTTVRSRTADISKGVTTWSAWQTVAAAAGDDRVLDPQLVMSANGDTAVAAWKLQVGSAPYPAVVQSRTARIGHGVTSWQATHDLAPDSSRVDQPLLGISRDGSTAIALWTGRNVQSSAAHVDEGVATWGPVQDVSPPDGSIARVPQVALSADGTTAVAAWADQDPEQNDHVVRSRTATISDGTADWASDAEVLSGQAGGYGPHVAISRDGATAVSVWTAWSSGAAVAQSRTASIESGSPDWSPLQDLSAPNGTPGATDVALSADGTRAVAVWAFSKVRSRAASLSDGTPSWGRSRLVSDAGFGPLLGLSRRGTAAVAVWNREDGTKIYKTILQAASAHYPR